MMAIRVVELSALLRILLKREYREISLITCDRLFIVFFLSCLSIEIIRTGSLSFYSIGIAVDGLFVYFVFRSLIRCTKEIIDLLKPIAFMLLPFAVLMSVEAVSGKNLFHFMGGVPEVPVYREGYYRSQGSFRHAITAGTVGATFLPLYISNMLATPKPIIPVISIISCLVIVIASHSSGPLMTTSLTLLAWSCWFFRHNMKIIRWLAFSFIITLHLAMKAPVWFIFDRISGVIGGDGWHRSNIIDKFIKHFSDWWLVGMPIEDTWDWAATVTTFGTADITNHYVSIGINGGLISLLLLALYITKVFSALGKHLKYLYLQTNTNLSEQLYVWGIGCVIFGHVVNILSVSYWDQSYIVWYFHLSIAATVGAQYSYSRSKFSNCS